MTSKVFEIVTNQILDLLKQGIAPWRAEWSTGAPKNFVTNREYRGYNALFLSFEQTFKQWSNPYYLTFRQAQERGWHVRKGEKANMVIFWKPATQSEPEDEEEEAEEAQEEEPQERPRARPVLRYYYVFNLDQIEGIPESVLSALKSPSNQKPIISCEELIKSFVPGLPPILPGSPSYSPKTDTIFLPPLASFKSPEAYYATRFHETIHATGAAHRLNRPGVTDVKFGSDNYSFEELIAEIGAAFLAALAGISTKTIEQDAAYIKHWLERLSNEPTWIIKAASQAQKAVDFLLGKKP